MTVQTLLPLGEGRLEVREVRAPETFVADAPSWVLVTGGAGPLSVAGSAVDVPARGALDGTAAWSALVATGTPVSLGGTLEALVIVRPGAALSESKLIPPDAVIVESRGTGPTMRVVRTYVPTGPLICGETISPPGGWSSWPPHRHEHEEVYVYRFGASDGFGLQLSYAGSPDSSDPSARSVVVRDGHVERIVGDYHPVVAAPHSWLYYAWVLAGTSDTLTPEPDARYT